MDNCVQIWVSPDFLPILVLSLFMSKEIKFLYYFEGK